MKKITLKSLADSNLGLFIWGVGEVFGEIAKGLYFPFTKKGWLYYKLCWFGRFPKFREITVNGNTIEVRYHVGHRNSPDFVQMYEFDVKSKTYIEYRNVNPGRENVIKGTLEEGIKKFT